MRLASSSRDHFPPFVNINQNRGREDADARVESSPRLTFAGAGWPASPGMPTVSRSAETPPANEPAGRLPGRGRWRHPRYATRPAWVPGHSFPDLFPICDIRARLTPASGAALRPALKPDAVLIHPQPDDTWRIDWQVLPGTDVDAERAGAPTPARAGGDRRNTEYELLWLTLYRFQRWSKLRGRVLLAGDAAHVVSPFGARGRTPAWLMPRTRPGSRDVLAGRASAPARELPPARRHREHDRHRCQHAVHGPAHHLHAVRNRSCAGASAFRLCRLSTRVEDPAVHYLSLDRHCRGAGLAAPGGVAPDAVPLLAGRRTLRDPSADS